MAQDAPAGTTLHLRRVRGGGALVALTVVEIVLGAAIAAGGIALTAALAQYQGLLLAVIGAAVALYGGRIFSLWSRSARLDAGPGVVVRASSALSGRTRLEGESLAYAAFVGGLGGRGIRYIGYSASGRRTLIIGSPYWAEQDVRALGDVVGIGPGAVPGIGDARAMQRHISGLAASRVR